MGCGQGSRSTCFLQKKSASTRVFTVCVWSQEHGEIRRNLFTFWAAALPSTALSLRLCSVRQVPLLPQSLFRLRIGPPGEANQSNKSGERTRMMVASLLSAFSGLGVGWGWGEVTFQSVDRRTHGCEGFLSRQRHLDGRLRDHQ